MWSRDGKWPDAPFRQMQDQHRHQRHGAVLQRVSISRLKRGNDPVTWFSQGGGLSLPRA